jgi:hypothetical protein
MSGSTKHWPQDTLSWSYLANACARRAECSSPSAQTWTHKLVMLGDVSDSSSRKLDAYLGGTGGGRQLLSALSNLVFLNAKIYCSIPTRPTALCEAR